MVLHKQYLKVGSSAKNRLFGVSPFGRCKGVREGEAEGGAPLQMLISGPGRIGHARLAVLCFGLFTLAIGIILSSIPWADYIIIKNLKLLNGSLSAHYWQRPGVIRLTKVYIFNVTNAENFLNFGEKPKLVEVGPYVYREDMEKVNIKFHDNGTVSYQHNKILNFVPELSVDKSLKLTVPNIPLLTLASQSNSLNRFLKLMISMAVRNLGLRPFVHVTAEELVFGYDDKLTALAHTFYPKHRRPMKQMGLLIGRNGSGVNEVHTIHTGEKSMHDFGYLDKLNGLDRLPFWSEKPCNRIRASEGSFFPPPDITKDETLYVYDKDLCRVMPLQYRHMTSKNGIKAGLYTPADNVFEVPEKQPDNKCFCPHGEVCAPRGLQNISPCQFDAPVFISYPHFYNADPELLDRVEGLKPVKEIHESYFKIQPKLGVPVEGKVRLQLNLRVDKAPHISAVAKFPDIIFPVVWLEEGVAELPPNIQRLVYLATTVADAVVPVFTWSLVVIGAVTLICIFIRAYKDVVFTRETIERGKETIRRGSSFIINGQHRLLIVKDSYTLLNNMSQDPDPEAESSPSYDEDK